ncbi:MAG: NTP transferase domain-containing protein, partial [Firmicutes bacterium]|nr:NTP transferase domain-containing protein [Bacillota bacterium]
MRLLAAVLAAGAARRFGADKLSARLAGRPVLAWTLDGVLQAAQAFPLGVVVVAAPGRAPAGARVPGAAIPVRVVENPDAEEGMASSVRVAARCAQDLQADGLL